MIVEWASSAIDDCDDIFAYIRRDSLRAARATDIAIETQAERLIDFPHSGRPGRHAGTRELVIIGTPYIAAYIITEDAVRILRVLHGAQQWPRTMSRKL